MNHPIIGIKNILYILRKYLKLIIILSVMGGIVGGLIFVGAYMGKRMGTSNYIITSSLAINAKNINGKYPGDAMSPDKNDFELEIEMVDAISFICKSKALLEKVVSKMSNTNISVQHIQNALSIEQYKETQIVTLKIVWTNPKQGEEVLNNILELLPEKIVESLNVGSVTVISDPDISKIESVVSAKFVPLVFLMGLGLGVVYAFLNLIFRPTLIDVRDVKYLFAKEFAGDIPLDLEYSEVETEHNLTTTNGISHEFSEHTAAIASVVENSLKESGDNKIFVTSTAAQEGKTCAVACVAKELARLGRKVLIIDMNTKSPSVGGLFLDKIEIDHTINSVANESIAIRDAVVQVDENLFVLPGLLRNEKVLVRDELIDAINDVSADYDITIFDTSPMDAVVDVLRIKDIVNKCLFVVGFDYCSVSQIQNALINLEKVGVDVTGIVVNGVKPKERKTSYFLDRKALQIDKKVLGKNRKPKKKRKK